MTISPVIGPSFYSHDDVIGKITLSKEAIGSQAKGMSEPICTRMGAKSKVKNTRLPTTEGLSDGGGSGGVRDGPFLDADSGNVSLCSLAHFM